MSTIVDSIDTTVAARIRGERASRRWSLDDLAERAGVSKAMISKIERGETSPTAALLGRLSAAFGITLSAFFADTAQHRGPVRRAEQPVWRDPATGYIRRQVAASPTIPVEMTEVELPARRRGVVSGRVLQLHVADRLGARRASHLRRRRHDA